MKHFNLLQKYLSNLAVLNVKLHNIHWNVVGNHFLNIHNFTEETYDELFEAYDEVAELLKMKDVYPLSSMAQYLELSDIKELKAQDFNSKEAHSIIKEDLEKMRELASEIRKTADEEGDFETVAIFEDYVAGFSKRIWFLSAKLK